MHTYTVEKFTHWTDDPDVPEENLTDYIVTRSDGESQIYQWHDHEVYGQVMGGGYYVIGGEDSPDEWNLLQHEIEQIIQASLACP
jgi:hypothetical protein